MLKSITTKYCAGAIAAAAILICAPKAEATITATLQVGVGPVNSLGTTIGSNPETLAFTFAGPTGVAGTGIQILNGSVNSQIIGGIGQLFDSTVTVNNNSGSAQTLRFIFTETSTTLTNPAAGISLASSQASGTNPNAPIVTLTSFVTTINGQTLTNVGSIVDGGVLGPVNYTFGNGVNKNVLVPLGAFSMSQDFTLTIAAGANFNFSNSAQVPTPVITTVVPEPGSFLAGASVLGLIGGSQLLRRKRNREVAC